MPPAHGGGVESFDERFGLLGGDGFGLAGGFLRVCRCDPAALKFGLGDLGGHPVDQGALSG
jgi:hypothetical protein